MATVKILDKTFQTSIPESEILQHVKAVAKRINNDLADKNPLFLAVLNGAFVFAADLLREITIPEGVVELDDCCFSGCVALREISIPGSVTAIGSGAFMGCGSLASVVVPADAKWVLAGDGSRNDPSFPETTRVQVAEGASEGDDVIPETEPPENISKFGKPGAPIRAKAYLNRGIEGVEIGVQKP